MHRYRYVRPHSLIKSKNLDLESCSQLRMSTKFGIIFDIIEYTICHLFNSTYDFDFMNIWIWARLTNWHKFFDWAFSSLLLFFFIKIRSWYIYKLLNQISVFGKLNTSPKRLNIFIVKNNYLGIYFSFSAGVIV